jgi:hypothetical protein
MTTVRTYPPFFEQWLAGGRSRLVSDALSRLTPTDMVNIIEGLPAEQGAADREPPKWEFDDTAFHRLPEIRAFSAYLREAGQAPAGRLKALRTAWETTLLQKRPEEWTSSDIFECLSSVAATRLVSAAQLAQAALLFWQSRQDDPQAARYRERLIDFLEGALIMVELRQARIIR